ncbi:predicted protein [Nematostella vectensis]|uniref:Nucleolar protein 6 n=1 Tax=Nematostella vectensis TaxID=45351 RepID=A7T9G4_NEMVE|nr:predicted protein [Nematostella vectensis]|eukprot:XP_001619461.1 hypothetical protein NEMVEDRAFT_v1g224156 [Nematostella vectensis]
MSDILNGVLLAIPDGKKEYKLSDMSWLPRKVVFPLPPTPSPVKGKFKFLKPSAVNIVGSYQLKTAIKPSFNVDVSINMPKRLAPNKSNVRLNWLFPEASSSSDIESVLPTPHYNSLILRDMVLGGHLRCLFQCMNDCPSAREAIMLLSVWLRQRELDEGQGGFSRFLVSMVVAHLHTTRKINSYMSSYQIVRIFLQFISSSDWTTCTAIKKDQNSDENNLEAAIFREFWGSKSELRRFKDGSILEAVVWPSSSAGERRTVCERIIKYLLNR